MKPEEAIDRDPTDPSHDFNLGRLLWQRGDEEGSEELKEKAVEHFVAAAKRNPNNGAAFRYLGRYYDAIAVPADRQRAAKCYQRAVTLDADDSEAGECLCGLLDGEGKESLEIAVCREASERSPRAFWAFRRLGYMQVYQMKWQDAIRSLQHAIRGYPSCADLWEALGLAYQRMGMLTAAIKSYGRAVELDEQKLFALVESGNIHVMLGSFSKGVDQFRHAREISPNNLSACFGLASSLLGLSKECINSGAFDWGASLLKEASDIAMGCAFSIGNGSCAWKLLGDIQVTYSKCLPWVNESKDINIDEKLLEISLNHWKAARLSSAVNAKNSYQRALHLIPWQANAYTDVATSLDLIYSFEGKSREDLGYWNLIEKMSLAGLLLKGDNPDNWVVLGCLSNNNALKQHCFVRALQLDVSLSVAWAHLGKLYRKLGEKLLSKQAFDHARSIDPSLALPWAGMAVDASTRQFSKDEAYESCLRAVQMFPLADFQLGLGLLAKLADCLLYPQVFGAAQQAVQHVPFYPESHNLCGLVYEARSDFQSAIAAYRRAKHALSLFYSSESKSGVMDVSFNLARLLCKAGYAYDAVCECEELKKEGFLDSKGLQIYAVASWKLGKNDMALAAAKKFAEEVSSMDQKSAAAALGLISKLVCCISGLESGAATIARIPREFLRNPRISSIAYAISSIEPKSCLQSLLGDITLRPEEASDMHYLVAIHEGGITVPVIEVLVSGATVQVPGQDVLSGESDKDATILKAVNYLKKVLHIYPYSSAIRYQISSLILSSRNWKASHDATRLLVLPSQHSFTEGSKSAYEIIGSASVACYSSSSDLKLSFPTCDQFSHLRGLTLLQRWYHMEPWNHNACYLLVLNLTQKAREEKFPPHICALLKRLIFSALSRDIYLKEDASSQYQKFQLLLCASEICLQSGGYQSSINHAENASHLPMPGRNLFCAHLQLCRIYAALGDVTKLSNEYMQCLNLDMDYEFGWISLNYFAYKYDLKDNLKSKDSHVVKFLSERDDCREKWAHVLDLLNCQRFLGDLIFSPAEQSLNSASVSLGNLDRCLVLCYGAICLCLARQQDGQYLSLAVRFLTRAQRGIVPLPIASILQAQAEGSLGARARWEKNLRAEWFSWPPEMKPAEIYFQMHLLAKSQSSVADRYRIELSQSPLSWVLRAVHLDPSCSRYRRVLPTLTEL